MTGFFARLHKNISNNKIGELLVKNNKISQAQLDEALQLQHEDKRALGRILHDMGAVSKHTLAKSLGQQVLYRVLTAAVTVTLSLTTFGTTKQARAETFSFGKRQVQKASIFSIPDFDLRKENPKLFGSAEKKSNNLAAFTKWNDVVARFDAGYSKGKQWTRDIMRYKNLSKTEKVKRINEYVNGYRYIEDKHNYGKSDYWATANEFFSRRSGDCEDFALAKYTALKMLGISEDDMRLAIVHDKVKDIPHAILIVYTNDGAMVLDNQSKATLASRDVNRYKPIYSINQNAWWRHS